ncbi:putative methylmalonate-semialdehyde dehydrogenase [acylating] [Paramyrothecium foliicola]|nr:putative methylmalonate-semialdehyde dehydrogenase [acylating] [Paramyrothecium foliicola]
MASAESVGSDPLLESFGSPGAASEHNRKQSSQSNVFSPHATEYFPHPQSPSSLLPPPTENIANIASHNSLKHHSPIPVISNGIIATAHNFINNALLQSKSRTWTKVYDPAFLTRVPESTLLEAQQAVAAATAAQTEWAAIPTHLRRVKVLDLVNAVQVNKYKIINCLVAEIGKTLQDAETEFERGLDSLLAATGIGSEMRGNYWSGSPSNTHTVYEPLGVCISVTPFNFPFMIPLWTIPVAVLTGNTIILKPSDRAPSSSMILAECVLNAGFPPGVVNIIHGGPSTVGALLSQPAVKAVHYVGSDIGGEMVYEHAKANRKRVQVECGGKNHAIVMPDASRRESLYALAGSAFGAAGQRCMASSVVVFVGSSSEWLAELVDIASSLVVGCGADPSVGMGPLITAGAKERVIAMINEAEQDGAQVLLDGRNCYVEAYPNGNFVGPTVLTGVETYMQCYQEEIFGPVLLCLQVSTLSEAIDLINDHRYGNGCSIFTSCPATAKTFQDQVNVGQVGINVPVLGELPNIMVKPGANNACSSIWDDTAHYK